MTGRLSYIILLISMCHALSAGHAQEIPHFVERLTTAEGLSSNKTTDIVQDDQGFLWIATSDGLNRFDGTEVVHYFHEDSSNSLPHNYIYCLQKLPGNYLAIGTEAGLSFYNGNTGIFRNFYYRQNNALDEHNNTIVRMATDSRGNLWAASRNCLFIFDTRLQIKKIIPSPFTESDATRERLHFAEKIVPLANGDVLLWMYNGWHVGSSESGRLVKMEESAHKNELAFLTRFASRHITVKTGHYFPEAHAFKVFGNYFLCIKPGADSLLLFDEQGKKRSSCYFPFNKYPYVSWSHKVCMIDSSRLLFLFHNYGMTFIPVSWSGDHPVIHPPAAQLFEENEYGNALRDRQGNWWLATTEEGLLKISPSKQSFKSHILVNDTSGKETKYEVLSALRDNNTFWTTTYGDGFFETDLQTGRQRHHRIHTKGNETIENFIWNIRKVSADTLWLGTQAGLFWYCIPARTNGRVRYKSKPGILDSVAITTQFVDSRGWVWMGLGKGKGLCRFDTTTKQFTYYPGNSATGYPLRYPTGIAEDSKGNLWFVNDASKALVFRNSHTGQFQKVLLRGTSTQLIGNLCGIWCENDSVLWLGSITSGLIKFHTPSSTAVIYGHDKGLANSHVSSIYKDRANRLWLTTDGSISCFNLRTATFTNYSTNDGLPVRYPTGFFYYDEKDKRLYNGGHGAFFWFDPEKMNNSQAPPKSIITAVKVNGMPYMFSPGKPARLRATQNDITIYYTAIDLTDGPKTRYAYRLVGEDTRWRMAGNQRQINFSRLAPGSYTFIVRAASNNGIWSHEEARISFYIRPTFTQTAWFYGLIVLATGAVCYLLYRFRLRQLKKTEEVRSEISRNLHDEVGASLTNISLSSLLAQQQLHNEDAVNRLLDRIYQDSQNVSEAMRDIVWSINPQIDTLGEALPRMLRYASGLLEAKGIELEADIDPDIEHVKFPMQQRRDLYLIFKETVNNLARHSAATKASVTFYLKNNHVIMNVSDNGKGFNTALPQVNNGLKNMRERSKNHHWQFDVVSSAGKGTSLTLQAPIA